MNSSEISYIADVGFKSAQHAQLLFVACSDFRFRQAFFDFQKNFLQNRGIDQIIVPGGVLCFFGGRYGYPDSARVAEFWARFLGEHHHIEEVILLGHEDCAAYANAPKLKSLSGEQLKEEQLEDLLAAKQVIEDSLPNVKVKTFLASLDSALDKIVFSEIS